MQEIAIIAILAIVVLLLLRGGTSTGGSIVTGQPSTSGNAVQGNPPQDIGGVDNVDIPNAVLQWQDLASKYAVIHSILDPEEILAIIWNESSGNPNAMNAADPSWGLMGVTLPIGVQYAAVSQGTDLLDPETNIQAGSGYLADLKAQFGSSANWSQAYNEGPGNFSAGKQYNPSYSVNFNVRVDTLKGYNA
jgi:hypothetical protein